MSTIAIIGAMDEEVANIASALSDITVTEEAGVSVTRGTIETNKGTRVNVAATVGGMGTVNIAATTQHLIDADQPEPAHQRRGAWRHVALPRHRHASRRPVEARHCGPAGGGIPLRRPSDRSR